MRLEPASPMIRVWDGHSVGVVPGPAGHGCRNAMGEMGMNDARLDRSRTGDALGDARPDSAVAPNHQDAKPDVVPTRDWTRTARGRSATSRLVHWFDEKGAVVRLITSADPDDDAGGA